MAHYTKRSGSRKPRKRKATAKKWTPRKIQAFRAETSEDYNLKNKVVSRSCERTQHGSNTPGTGRPPRKRKAVIQRDSQGNLTRTGAKQIADIARNATPKLNNRGKRKAGYKREGSSGCARGKMRASKPNTARLSHAERRAVRGKIRESREVHPRSKK